MLDRLQDLPLYWAKIIGTAFFLAVIVWALLRPRAYIFRGAPDGKAWRDLRLWALIVLLAQVAVYIRF